MPACSPHHGTSFNRGLCLTPAGHRLPGPLCLLGSLSCPLIASEQWSEPELELHKSPPAPGSPSAAQTLVEAGVYTFPLTLSDSWHRSLTCQLREVIPRGHHGLYLPDLSVGFQGDIKSYSESLYESGSWQPPPSQHPSLPEPCSQQSSGLCGAPALCTPAFTDRFSGVSGT